MFVSRSKRSRLHDKCDVFRRAVIVISCLAAISIVHDPARTQGVAPDSILVPRGRATSDTLFRPLPFTRSDSVALPRKKSPGTALLLSALLPGAGQFYDESYWKVPIVTGLGAYFIAQWINANSSYHDYRDQYSASLLTTPSGDTRLYTLREFYKDQRDSFTWYYLILYFVNLADAYVDASLFDFNVGPDLSLCRLPCGPKSPALTIRWKF